jgi:GxxExxY protein
VYWGRGCLNQPIKPVLKDELTLQGIDSFESKQPLMSNTKVCWLSRLTKADFLVNDRVIIERKTVDNLLPVHRAQLLTYLKWGGLKLGLLFNFNSKLLKQGIQRVVNNF